MRKLKLNDETLRVSNFRGAYHVDAAVLDEVPCRVVLHVRGSFVGEGMDGLLI